MIESYYSRNREKKLAYAKKYREDHLGQVREYQKRHSREYQKKLASKAYRAKWMREWRKHNPEKAKAAEDRRSPRPRAQLDKKNAKQRERYDVMKEKFDRIQLKREVFEAYSGASCKCCPEGHPDKRVFEFLSIDHINGGGVKHRREIGVTSGDGFYKWLKKNKFPSGFQVLCHNCNKAKWAYGQCPHQKVIHLVQS